MKPDLIANVDRPELDPASCDRSEPCYGEDVRDDEAKRRIG
jgi:hypothetical protein